MTQVYWVKSTADGYLDLAHVDLQNVIASGVYVIWRQGNGNRAVKIGQGNIRDRLTKHRADPEVLAYRPLNVTWAVVPADQMDGIERYLANHYAPLIGDAFPDALPIPVNLVA